MRAKIALAAAAFAALPLPGRAVDGVLEINQSCALTGCFGGDTPGFPVTIDGSAGRSYRLTGDLVVPDSGNTSGIYLNGTSISVDLNGFEIIGPGCIRAISAACRPASGSGNGIEANLGATDSYLGAGISVSNGSITGMARHAVVLGARAEVRRLRVRWNGVHGISARDGSIIADSNAFQNGGDGISVGGGSRISGNDASENLENGIATSAGSTIADNVAVANRRTGIQVGVGIPDGGATISGNTAVGNVLNGISAQVAASVAGNTASGNGNAGIIATTGSTVSGNTASGNGGDGIVTGGDCLVERNTARGNAGFGLSITPDTGYRSNVINANVGGTVLNGGVNLGANSCNGAAACP